MTRPPPSRELDTPTGPSAQEPSRRLPLAYRARTQDRSRWCRACRTHRRGGCEVRRQARDDSTLQRTTPTSTDPPATSPARSGNQSRTTPQPPAACRTRYRGDTVKWCEGCRSRKRGCDARRTAGTATPTTIGGAPTTPSPTAEGVRANEPQTNPAMPEARDTAQAQADDRPPGSDPATIASPATDRSGTGRGPATRQMRRPAGSRWPRVPRRGAGVGWHPVQRQRVTLPTSATGLQHPTYAYYLTHDQGPKPHRGQHLRAPSSMGPGTRYPGADIPT